MGGGRTQGRGRRCVWIKSIGDNTHTHTQKLTDNNKAPNIIYTPPAHAHAQRVTQPHTRKAKVKAQSSKPFLSLSIVRSVPSLCIPMRTSPSIRLSICEQVPPAYSLSVRCTAMPHLPIICPAHTHTTKVQAIPNACRKQAHTHTHAHTQIATSQHLHTHILFAQTTRRRTGYYASAPFLTSPALSSSSSSLLAPPRL